MEAIYMIMEMLEELKTDKIECIEKLRALERSETMFKRFTYEKIVYQTRIETLRKIEKRLKKELRRLILMYEIEA